MNTSNRMIILIKLFHKHKYLSRFELSLYGSLFLFVFFFLSFFFSFICSHFFAHFIQFVQLLYFAHCFPCNSPIQSTVDKKCASIAVDIIDMLNRATTGSPESPIFADQWSIIKILLDTFSLVDHVFLI